jgi:hypothetical protein
MAAITRHWKDWISRYSADGAYWYVPKGKSIADVATIHQQLGVLKRKRCSDRTFWSSI